MLFVLVLQLLIMLKMFRVDSVMTRAVMVKSGMKAEHCGGAGTSQAKFDCVPAR